MIDPTCEWELLLGCARVHLGAAEAARVRELARRRPDWEGLHALAGNVPVGV